VAGLPLQSKLALCDGVIILQCSCVCVSCSSGIQQQTEKGCGAAAGFSCLQPAEAVCWGEYWQAFYCLVVMQHLYWRLLARGSPSMTERIHKRCW
jgi:hypothetical protein